MYTEPNMSKDVLNIWKCQKIYISNVGWGEDFMTLKRGREAQFSTSRDREFTFGFGSATDDMKADQNDRHEYVVLFLQTKN